MSWFPQPPAYRFSQSTRGTAPVIGGLLVVALTVILATIVGTAMLGGASSPEPAPTTAVDLTVEGDTLRFTHESGEPLDVRTLSVWIAVDGDPLDEQPPVPFFSASGFEPGPTGPFNTATDPEWSVGETASLTVAGTNSPQIEPGRPSRSVSQPTGKQSSKPKRRFERRVGTTPAARRSTPRAPSQLS